MKQQIGYGFLIVAVFLGTLALLPQIFKKSQFFFDGPVAGSQMPSFDMDHRLEVYKPQKGVASPLSLREAMGGSKKALVNLWATWCPPCIEEMPSLELLQRQLQQVQDSTTLITIATDEELKVIEKLFETLDFKPSFLVLHDPNGRWIQGQTQTSKFPESFLIGSDGQVTQKWIGPQDWLSDEVLTFLE